MSEPQCHSLQKATESALIVVWEVKNQEEKVARRKARDILRKFKRSRSSLIPILQQLQLSLGYLPRPTMVEAARYLRIPEIQVYSVATFYNQFRLVPPGKHQVRVCLGTACHTKGGQLILEAWERRLGIKPGQTTDDREFDLDIVACVGCCMMAPVTVVDGVPEGKLSPTKVDGILLSKFGRKFGEEKTQGRDNSKV